MRRIFHLALLPLVLLAGNAQAGRTGQAKSAEVLAKRTKASPRGSKEWGGISMGFMRAGQKEVRSELRRATPASAASAEARGKDAALLKIREIVGKHLGLTPGQLAYKDRRYQRNVKKQLRRMLREVRTARASGRPFRDAFPDSLATSYSDLDAALSHQIADRPR